MLLLTLQGALVPDTTPGRREQPLLMADNLPSSYGQRDARKTQPAQRARSAAQAPCDPEQVTELLGTGLCSPPWPHGLEVLRVTNDTPRRGKL